MWVKIDVCKAADRRASVYTWVKIDVCKAADRRQVVYMWVKIDVCKAAVDVGHPHECDVFLTYSAFHRG